jgi:type I restriction enzyme S subunit
LRPGRFVYNPYRINVGSIGLSAPSQNGICSPAYVVFEPTERINPHFLRFFLKSARANQRINFHGNRGSVRSALRFEDLCKIEIPLPPIEEQQRVLATIEKLATQIREAHALRRQAIEKTEVLLYSLLRTERNRLLDSPHPKSQLGTVTKVTSGGTPSRDNLSFWDGEIPWVKTGELLDGDISHTEEHITEAGVENSSARIFPAETVLIALYGQGQTRGRTGRLTISAATNQACCAILPNPEKFIAHYVQFWLRSLYVELREEAQGGAQPNWNGAMIKELEVAFPSLPEQCRIVAELDALQGEVDALKRLQTETAVELDALLPSILDRAFKGEL